MAELNKLQMQVWGRKQIWEPNTFIGNMGDVVTSAYQMSLRIVSGRRGEVKNFQIDANNNISFYIGRDYELISAAFSTDRQLTFYYDLDGRIKTIIGRTFGPYPAPYTYDMKYGYFPGLVLTTGTQNFAFHISQLNYNFEKLKEIHFSQVFRDNGARNLRLPMLDVYVGPEMLSNSCQLATTKRLYVPRLNVTIAQSTSTTIFDLFRSGNILYTHPDMATANSGSPHPSVADVISRGGIVRYVSSFTPPANITDLSASDITATSVKLNFTPPTAVNGMDFYGIWLDDGTGKLEQKYFPIQQELTASGQTLTGLTTGTIYKIKLSAIDMFYNGAGQSTTPAFSNEITITTL